MGKAQERKQFRVNSLKNRTKAEIWTEDVLLRHFKWFDFIPEYQFKFRRFDFYFPSLRVAVEVDGSYHSGEQSKYDARIDIYLLQKFKVIVLRVPNFDLIKLMDVIKQIKQIQGCNYMQPKKKVILRKKR